MKLIFMGTPDFAVPSLRALAEAGHEIVSVYTQPDRPKGRGYALEPPPVKVQAQKLGLPVFQPETLRNENVQRQIADTHADCAVVVAYGKLLPPPVLTAPRLGCVNVHSSLLPKFRGAAPIQWAILTGERVTGVSTMLLDEGMDTGNILLQSETNIDPFETAGQLHDRLAVMGADMIIRTLDGLDHGEITPRKQDESAASYAPMLTKDLCPINWGNSSVNIHNQVRGLQPWPVAETAIEGKRLRIHSTVPVIDYKGEAGVVMSTSPLIVSCGEGAIEIKELQIDGGKRMAAADYLMGHPIAVGARLG